jgi:hypothetical protein
MLFVGMLAVMRRTPAKFGPLSQVLLVTPHVSALEPWTSKKSLPRSIEDGANSCAAVGTFYYQYVGKNPTDAGIGELLKYSTTSDTWSTGNAFAGHAVSADRDIEALRKPSG